MPHAIHPTRRSLCLATAAALLPAWPLRAQPARPYLADIHSHLGLIAKRAEGFDMGQVLRAAGVTLLSWNLVDDGPWTIRTAHGIQQTRQPAPGDLWRNFQRRNAAHDAMLAAWGLARLLVPADVDAALAGELRVVRASESANFLEGRPERVAEAHAMGLRHLQLIHYIETPLGNLQTASPHFDTVQPVALQVIAECRRLGMVVDLAHSTPDLVDAALDGSDAVLIWSHSYISRAGGSWKDAPILARSLSPAQAKKIAAHGGIVGLWSARWRSNSAYPVYSVASYADEIVRMAELLGPEHVAFGTDMEGVGANPVLSDYADLRAVADNLARRGMAEADLHKVCIGNYARVLKQAMGGADRR